MPYEYSEEVATADIAFRAWDATLEGLFIAAADATLNVMVEDLESIRPSIDREISIENDSLEMLLFNFLNEIIYYKDADVLFLRVRSVRIQENGLYRVHANCKGEKFAPERHHSRVDVKAITLHRFTLKKTNAYWEAFAVLDI
jgi:SHS2 domain-containing protein